MTASADQSEPASCTIETTIKPQWPQWASALSSHTPSTARQQLGIPNDRPVVFSGHQPMVFHNGILAKLIAQHEAAKRTGAARVWIVADQDPVELETLRVPFGQGKSLRHEQTQLLKPGATPPGVPSAALPAVDPLEVEDERLRELVSYLQGYTHETNLGRQFASATIQLACDHLGIEIPRMLYASELLGLHSEALWQYTYKMNEDSHKCVHAYNNAVRAHPDARVRPLQIEGDRVELPLWGLRKNFARVAIDTDNIGDFKQNELIPRGLFMSLLVRAHLGELFIHGTGGWEYDKITQDWARDWLDIELAPMAMTTATQRLDLGFDSSQVVSVGEASWAYHHARHTPAMLGDEDTQERKDHLVEQISDLKQAGENPDHAYQKLVMLLEDYRVHNQVRLDELKSRIAHARASQRQIELANDRTWPFVLFNDEQLEALRDAVVAALV